MGIITFWSIATLMVAATTALVVVPLYVRSLPNNPDAPARSRLIRFTPALVIALAFPLLALGFYVLLGTPPPRGAVGAAPVVDAHARVAALQGRSDGGDLDSAIERLRERLAKNPDDKDGWRLLAQSYQFQGRTAEAADATMRAGDAQPAAANAAATPQVAGDTAAIIARAQELRRKREFAPALAQFAELARRGALDADLWADYADTLGGARGSLDAEATGYIERALALDPRHTKALWLLGSVQTQKHDYRAALATWQRLEALMPKDSSDARLIAANVEEARAALGRSTEAQPTSAAAPAPAAANVRGRVTLDAGRERQVVDGAVLYVFARAADERGPPLAVMRVPATTWPVEFSLGDADAMMPARKLSDFSRVVVEARVSMNGSATPSPGDLRAVSAVIDPHRAPRLALAVNEVVGTN